MALYVAVNPKVVGLAPNLSCYWQYQDLKNDLSRTFLSLTIQRFFFILIPRGKKTDRRCLHLSSPLMQ
jgi:hypothetical protein